MFLLPNELNCTIATLASKIIFALVAMLGTTMKQLLVFACLVACVAASCCPVDPNTCLLSGFNNYGDPCANTIRRNEECFLEGSCYAQYKEDCCGYMKPGYAYSIAIAVIGVFAYGIFACSCAPGCCCNREGRTCCGVEHNPDKNPVAPCCCVKSQSETQPLL